jgi:hypothetical protein
MVHYGYDTTALANGTAKTILDDALSSIFLDLSAHIAGDVLDLA